MEDKRLENQINPGLTFGLLKGKAKAFAKGEITQKDIGDWGNTLTVLTNLPMEIKMACLISLISKYYYTDTMQQEIIVSELYRNIFFEVYLRYLGINEIYPEEYTYQNYDLMDPLYGPWIESMAGRDIKIFKEMLNNAIGLYGSTRLIEAVSLLDPEALASGARENTKLITELGKNAAMIQNLKELVAFNDPGLKEAIEKMEPDVNE